MPPGPDIGAVCSSEAWPRSIPASMKFFQLLSIFQYQINCAYPYVCYKLCIISNTLGVRLQITHKNIWWYSKQCWCFRGHYSEWTITLYTSTYPSNSIRLSASLRDLCSIVLSSIYHCFLMGFRYKSRTYYVSLTSLLCQLDVQPLLYSRSVLQSSIVELIKTFL